MACSHCTAVSVWRATPAGCAGRPINLHRAGWFLYAATMPSAGMKGRWRQGWSHRTWIAYSQARPAAESPERQHKTSPARPAAAKTARLWSFSIVPFR